MRKLISRLFLGLAICGMFFALEKIIPANEAIVKAEAGGSQGSQVSESVNEDETYWIHFSDGETIINSQEVVYGTTPQFSSYQVQDGYVFLGWKYYTSEGVLKKMSFLIIYIIKI